MNPSQFDTMTRFFAARRLSRRRALATGGGLAALTLTGAAAQDATVQIRASGADEVEALQAVARLFEDRFNEE